MTEKGQLIGGASGFWNDLQNVLEVIDNLSEEDNSVLRKFLSKHVMLLTDEAVHNMIEDGSTDQYEIDLVKTADFAVKNLLGMPVRDSDVPESLRDFAEWVDEDDDENESDDETRPESEIQESMFYTSPERFLPPAAGGGTRKKQGFELY